MNAQQLTLAAREKGITQQWLAKNSGTSQSVISRIQSGDGYVSADVLEAARARLMVWLHVVEFNGEWFLMRRANENIQKKHSNRERQEPPDTARNVQWKSDTYRRR